MFRTSAAVVFLTLTWVLSPSLAEAQSITLFEKPNGKGRVLCKLSLPVDQGLQVNFKAGGHCENDEARSALLEKIPQNMSIYLFDNPGFSRKDDYIRIRATKKITRRIVPNFERNLRDDPAVSVIYRSHNGLNGKVSSLLSRPYRVAACNAPSVNLSASGDDPVTLRATASSSCQGHMHLRLRRNIPGQRDRNLKQDRAITSMLELTHAYRCEKSSYGNTLFAELIYNGKKLQSKRLDICDGFTTKPTSPKAVTFSKAIVYNCDSDGTSHGIWVMTSGGIWRSEGRISSSWSGSGCLSPKGKTIELPLGWGVLLATTNPTLTGCIEEHPGVGQCQSSISSPLRVSSEGGVMVVNVN